jgi:group I intron endonuclease
MSLTIYKIIVPNCEKIYIGSTNNIIQRISQHKDYSKHYYNPNIQLYYTIRENGGWEKCVLEIIETDALKEREQFWVNSFSPNVFNINNPTGMTPEQFAINRKKTQRNGKKDKNI